MDREVKPQMMGDCQPAVECQQYHRMTVAPHKQIRRQMLVTCTQFKELAILRFFQGYLVLDQSVLTPDGIMEGGWGEPGRHSVQFKNGEAREQQNTGADAGEGENLPSVLKHRALAKRCFHKFPGQGGEDKAYGQQNPHAQDPQRAGCGLGHHGQVLSQSGMGLAIS